tara:strand:- start:5968 stop:6297 length:330 start_codon:yes stop_codon:yes gene_type:complete
MCDDAACASLLTVLALALFLIARVAVRTAWRCVQRSTQRDIRPCVASGEVVRRAVSAAFSGKPGALANPTVEDALHAARDRAAREHCLLVNDDTYEPPPYSLCVTGQPV